MRQGKGHEKELKQKSRREKAEGQELRLEVDGVLIKTQRRGRSPLNNSIIQVLPMRHKQDSIS